jgi:stage II sporulation protein D
MKYDFDGLSVGAAALRLALGGETMKSNMIEEIAIRDGRLMVKGRGYGHGVGMSQWGARALAEKGEDAEDIVEYFFDDIEIVRVQP